MSLVKPGGDYIDDLAIKISYSDLQNACDQWNEIFGWPNYAGCWP